MASSTTTAPMYRQVEETLRERILGGQYAPGQRLPDERRLAQELQVSRSTIRQALSRLGQDNLLERIQGSGSFVSRNIRQNGYLCAVLVGSDQRFNTYATMALMLGERLGQQYHLKFCVKYAVDEAEVPALVASINEDQTVVAGLMLGRVSREAAAAVVAHSRVAWVFIGDHLESIRYLPVMHQVVGDGYVLAESATRWLVDQGTKRFAFFVHDQDLVWNREMISAYRATLDNLGVSAANQQIINLDRLTLYPPRAGYSQMHRGADRILSAVQQWEASNCWPDGVIANESALSALASALLRTSAGRHHIEHLHVAALEVEEHVGVLHNGEGFGHLVWVALPLTELIEAALSLLRDQTSGATSPRRCYIRSVRIIDPSQLPNDTNSSSPDDQ